MRKSTRYLLTAVTALLLAITQLRAQDPVFSQFYSSPLSVNPALAGNGDASWRIVGNRRSQWLGEGVEPLTTTSICFDGKLFKQEAKESNYIAGGLMFLQDRGLSGAYKSNSFHFIVSSHVGLDEDEMHGLSIGLGGTYSNTVINFAELSFPQQLGPSGFNRALPTQEPYLSNIQPYFSMFAGINYSLVSEGASFDFGVSGYRFLKTARSALNDKEQIDPPRYNIHADYQTFLSDKWVFNSNAICMLESNLNSWTAGVNFGRLFGDEESPSVINAGIWYRSKEAVIPYLGFGYRNLQAGFTYDVPVGTYKSSLGNLKTYEISLIFRSPQRVARPIPCPWK
ncbi:PorP/SprF family type IX secretion system membrane protein [Sediminibacterium soli]|uniref:PorP/SprF family type IX secretion system membrane protein n=1 Tax=Sediminibacterium soli TaxID=2698829 RepID=UPI001379D46E|nr:PorP/SprF family type IX secretion system membrane protein [Sediminibacterium soli]NCI47480.1 type IX secretion system membrane protein PorP/SprF [Sediminibacterium soli]